jgi:hypothetical protein
LVPLLLLVYSKFVMFHLLVGGLAQHWGTESAIIWQLGKPHSTQRSHCTSISVSNIKGRPPPHDAPSLLLIASASVAKMVTTVRFFSFLIYTTWVFASVCALLLDLYLAVSFDLNVCCFCNFDESAGAESLRERLYCRRGCRKLEMDCTLRCSCRGGNCNLAELN